MSVFASDVRIGDVITDDWFAPPVTLTVAAIRGGAAFTFYGVDGEVISNVPPMYALTKGTPQ